MHDSAGFDAARVNGSAAEPTTTRAFDCLDPMHEEAHFTAESDAVLTDHAGRVREVRVKQPDPGSHWVWGAFKLSCETLHALHDLWEARERRDEYIGTLVNAWLAGGGRAVGVRAGETYVDVGTLHGYREAIGVLSARAALEAAR